MENNNNEFIDLVNIASFVLGIMNLQENLTQSDKQDIVNELKNETSIVLNKINTHLQEQDNKINKILELLNK